MQVNVSCIRGAIRSALVLAYLSPPHPQATGLSNFPISSILLPWKLWRIINGVMMDGSRTLKVLCLEEQGAVGELWRAGGWYDAMMLAIQLQTGKRISPSKRAWSLVGVLMLEIVCRRNNYRIFFIVITHG